MKRNLLSLCVLMLLPMLLMGQEKYPRPLERPDTSKIRHTLPGAVPETGLMYDSLVGGIIDQTNLDSLVSYVRILSGEDPVMLGGSMVYIRNRGGNPGGNQAADYLHQKLESYGLEVTEQVYSSTGRNVYAVQHGYLYPDRTYILCAHYDAVNEYCADDNASGAAAVVEAARILSQYNFNYTIVYALWDEEEIGLLGSSYYASQAASRGERIEGVLALDMLGWDGNGDRLADVHTRNTAHSNDLANTMVIVDWLYGLSLQPVIYNPGTWQSDHSRFWDRGYSAVLLIEAYYGGDLNPYYHGLGDRVDRFSLPYFHDMSKLSIGALSTLAEAMQDTFRIAVWPRLVGFGDAYLGFGRTETLFVRNYGDDTLVVSSILAGRPEFTVDPASFALPRHGTQEVRITFMPTDATVYIDSLTITSNDPGRPVLAVPLTGNGIHPPNLTVAPDSFSVSMGEGDSTTETMTLGNTGLGELTFEVIIRPVVHDRSLDAVGRADADVPTDGVTRQTLGGLAADALRGITMSGERLVDGMPIPAFTDTGLSTFKESLDQYERRIADFRRVNSLDLPQLAVVGSGAYDMMYYLLNDTSVVEKYILTRVDGYESYAQIRDYDGLIVCESDYGITEGEASAMREFCNTGKPIILGMDDLDDNFSYVPASRSLLTSIFGISDVFDGDFSWGTLNPENPITEGVVQVYPYCCDNDRYILDGGDWIYSGSDGNVYGVSHRGPSRTVIVGEYLAQVWYGGNQQLIENAIDWIMGGRWLSVNPSQGTILPGASLDIGVRFASAGLDGGSYDARIEIVNNDPWQNPRTIPARLRVSGKPVISILSDSIAFGDAYIGATATETVIVRNLGSDSLFVTGISSDDPAFTAAPAVLTIPAHGRRSAVLSFTPLTPAAYHAMLTLRSNDSSRPLLAIPVSGRGIYPPSIFVSPAAFDITMDEGDTLTRTLTIGNTGLGELQWKITKGRAEVDSSILAPGVVKPMPRTESEMTELAAVTSAASGGSGGGLPTISPYSLDQLMNLPGGKRILAWVGGADLTPGGEFENTLNAIYLHFTDFSVDTTTTTSADVLTSLLATHDILLIPQQEYLTGSAWSLGRSFAPVLKAHLEAGGSLIVLDSWTYYAASTSMLNGSGLLNINFGGCCGGYSAEVHDTGSPLVQGLPATFFTEYRASIHVSSLGRKIIREQSSGQSLVTARDFGSGQVVYIGMDFYQYNSNMGKLLANAVEWSGPRFLSMTPRSGIVPSGATQEVSIRFGAEALWSGDYAGLLVVTSNDPARSPEAVQVDLHVSGRPLVGVTPMTFDFDTEFVGYSRAETLIVENLGSAELLVTNIHADTAAYFAVPANFTISPHSRQEVVVWFSPVDTGHFDAYLTVVSNDAARPELTISLHGRGVYPPIMTVAPEEISATLAEGDSISTHLTIRNTGLGSLKYTLGKRPYNHDYALLFDGQDDWMEAPATGLPVGSHDRTIELWCRRLADRWDIMLIGYGTGPGRFAVGLSGYYVGVHAGVGYFSGNRGIVHNEWYHIAVVIEGNWTTLYVNGEPDGSRWWTVNTADSTMLTCGIPLSESGGRFWGDLDEIRIWNVARTAEEIRRDMHTELRGNETGLVGYWPMNEGTGEVAHDLTVGGMDGTLHGRMNWARYTVGLSPSWLSVSSDSGVCGPDSSVTVSIGLDATSLSAGWYVSGVSVVGSDPASKTKDVPVRFRVTGPPRFAVTPGSIDFDTVAVEFVDTHTLAVRNEGKDTLTVEAITSDTVAYGVAAENFVLAPFASRAVPVKFAPPDTGLYTDTAVVAVTGSDLSRPTARIPLRGRGFFPPITSLRPDTFAFMLRPGDTLSSTITIANAGSGALHAIVSLGGGVNWLMVTPETLVVSPGDSVVTHFTVCDAGLPAGVYGGWICVSANDPARPVIVVPVVLTVTTRRLIMTSADSLQFGEVPVGYADTAYLVMRNDGSGTTRVTSMSVDNPDYRQLGPTSYSLPQGCQRIIPVVFSPGRSGPAAGTLTVRTDHFLDSVISTNLAGSGVRPAVLSISEESLGVAFDYRVAGYGALTIRNLGTGPLSLKIWPEAGSAASRRLVIPLSVSDADGNSKSIVVGMHPEATRCTDWGLGESELPPLPPEGSFDVRLVDPAGGAGCFDQGTLTDYRPYVHPAQVDTFRLRIQAKHDAYPITTTWPSGLAGYARKLMLVDPLGGFLVHHDMTGGTSMVLFDPQIKDLLMIKSGAHTSDSCMIVSPDTGVLTPGDSLTVRIEFHACAGDSLSYTTYLTVLSNDPGRPASVIPIHLTILTGTEEPGGEVPETYALSQNYPNPFNPVTTISYGLPKAGHVRLSVFNILGQEVAVLANAVQEPGYKIISFDASDLPSGVYTYRIAAGAFADVKKMLLLK